MRDQLDANFSLPIQYDTALLIDGDCIYCERFAEISAARMRYNNIAIIDLRRDPDLIDAIRQQGVEPTEGMILKVSERYFYGSSAIGASLASFKSVPLHLKPLQWLFAKSWTAKPLYAIMKIGRFATLQLRGKSTKF